MAKPGPASRTAVLFVLRDEQQLRQGFTAYTMVVSFMDINHLPPYLPAVHFWLPDSDIRWVEENLAKCRGVFEECMAGVREWDAAAKASVSEALGRVSTTLYKCTPEFSQILTVINAMGVRHLIIFTDDRQLPWPWSYADSAFRETICDRYSCGIIFAQRAEGLDRISKYVEQRSSAGHGVSEKIALLVGASCDLEGVESELDIVERILSAERDDRGMPRKLRISDVRRVGQGEGVGEFRQLSSDAVDMKIIHFAGHVENDELVTGSYRITSDELDRMPDFLSNPVVFLNGCSSGDIQDLFDAGAQMCTKFLKKLAQACVVNLMPVQDDIASYLSAEFYTRIMGARDGTIQTLGQALQGIRRDMQREFPDDPQRLFFQLYGDPRSVLAFVGATDFIRDILETRR